MKNKGFTLIELLAVVILLGIVAVISVPVVKNITDDAKQKGLEKQISVVLESAKNWAVQNTGLLPETNGSVLVKADTLKKNGFLENKTIINPVDKSEMNGCAEISYVEDYNQYKYMYKDSCESFLALSQLATTSKELGVDTINSCVKTGNTCNVGIPVAIKVNAKEIYKFYVIKDDGTTVNLIMASNLGGTVAWNSSGDTSKGPLTALTALKERTKDWTNLKEYSYTLQGVQSSYAGVQNVRTRLPNRIEITENGSGCVKAKDHKLCPDWMIEGLNSNTPRGYWLSDTVDSSGNVWGVYYNRSINHVAAIDYEHGGVRPVITVQKTPVY